MRFEYWNSTDGKWSWHLKTSIGVVVARGTALSNRENCLAAIKLVMLAAGSPCVDVSPSVKEIVPPRAVAVLA